MKRTHSNFDDSSPDAGKPHHQKDNIAYRRHFSPETRDTEALAAFFPDKKDPSLVEAIDAVRSYQVEHSKRDDTNGRLILDDKWKPENEGLKRIAFVAAFIKGARETHMPEAHIKIATTQLLKHMSSGTPLSELVGHVSDETVNHKGRSTKLELHQHREGENGYKGEPQFASISGANLRKLITQAAKESEKAPVVNHAAKVTARESADKATGIS